MMRHDVENNKRSGLPRQPEHFESALAAIVVLKDVASSEDDIVLVPRQFSVRDIRKMEVRFPASEGRSAAMFIIDENCLGCGHRSFMYQQLNVESLGLRKNNGRREVVANANDADDIAESCGKS